MTGEQASISIIGAHGEARIASIDTQHLRTYLSQSKVCLVAGFQGIGERHEIYTLGRGGSDTSAVALAVSLQADACEIFTDVKGIYSADPNKVKEARLLARISYEEMLEMARLGAGVLHSRSVELASKHGLVLHVRSTFDEEEGSLVMPESEILEKALVRGVSLKKDEARLSVVNIQDRPGLAAKLFGSLASQDICVNIIVQSTGEAGQNTISFTVLQSTACSGKEGSSGIYP